MTGRKKKKLGPPTLKEALAAEEATDNTAIRCTDIRIMALHRFIELGGGRLVFKDQAPRRCRGRGRPRWNSQKAWPRRLMILAAAATCRMKGLAVPTSSDVAALCRALAEMIADEHRSPGKVRVVEEEWVGGRPKKVVVWYVVPDLLAVWKQNSQKQDHASALLEHYGASAVYDNLLAAEDAFIVEVMPPTLVDDVMEDPFWPHRPQGDELSEMKQASDDYAVEVKQKREAARAALTAGTLPPDELRAPAQMKPTEDEEKVAFAALLGLMRRADRTKGARLDRDGKLVEEIHRQMQAMLDGVQTYSSGDVPPRAKAVQPAHPLRCIGEWELALLERDPARQARRRERTLQLAREFQKTLW